MPPRKPHKKSRTGCLRCKHRKVKCDEVRPQCTNCIRQGTPCQYPTAPREQAEMQRAAIILPREPRSDTELQSITNEAAMLHSRAAAMGVSLDDQNLEDLLTADQHRQLDLSLLHHYESCAIWTIGSSITPEGREIWSTTAVDLSFEHPFLQTAILAFSALHITAKGPMLGRHFSSQAEEGAALRAVQRVIKWTCPLPPNVVHRMLLARALKQQQAAIQSITPQSANAVFLSTLLLNTQAMPRASVQPQPPSYEPPIQWLRMITANKTVGRLCICMLPTSNLAEPLLPEDGPDPRNPSLILTLDNCEPFRELIDWVSAPEQAPFTEAIQEAYTSTLAYVGTVYKAMIERETDKQIYHRLMCLGKFLPCEFADLVEERRPRALAILALYSSMAQLVDDHWLWHGFATHQVHGIGSILPADWQWAMIRPREILLQLQNKTGVDSR